jgi:hypothetical protein
MPRTRRFFSASKVLGLDRDIVGVGVARSPSASWLFSTRFRQDPFALCLAVPKGTRNLTPWRALVRAIIPSGKGPSGLYKGSWCGRRRCTRHERKDQDIPGKL